jgi:parallel beta-helix repeat protein
LQSSNDNTITKGTFGASDYNGVLLRDSSNNTLANNQINATGPIGAEFTKQIVGYFAAGVYVGWTSHDNLIQGNSGKNSLPPVEIDDGNVPAVTTPASQGQLPTLNPLNDQTTGGDPTPSWYQSLASGAPWAPEMPLGSPVAGTANQVCGNSFTGAASWPLGLDPNAPCS